VFFVKLVFSHVARLIDIVPSAKNAALAVRESGEKQWLPAAGVSKYVRAVLSIGRTAAAGGSW
jgi:hypothetical protein